MKSESYKLETMQDISNIINAMKRAINVNKGKVKLGVFIGNAKSIRSIKQNALIHVLFQRISDATASTGSGDRFPMSKIKAMMKHLFLGYEVVEIGTKKIEVLRSTAKLSKKSCADFVTNILNWCSDRNIDINLLTDEYEFIYD